MSDRTFPCQPIEVAPQDCSFCGRTLRGSAFVAVAKSAPFAAVCDRCVARYEILRRMALTSRLYGEPLSAWAFVQRQIDEALHAKAGSLGEKRGVATVVLSMAQRNAAILRGALATGRRRCPHSSVPLGPPRVALVGGHSDGIFGLLVHAGTIAGVPIIQAQSGPDGIAKAALALLCEFNGDRLLFPCGAVFASQYQRSDLACGMVYGVNDTDALPWDVTAIHVGGFDCAEVS